MTDFLALAHLSDSDRNLTDAYASRGVEVGVSSTLGCTRATSLSCVYCKCCVCVFKCCEGVGVFVCGRVVTDKGGEAAAKAAAAAVAAAMMAGVTVRPAGTDVKTIGWSERGNTFDITTSAASLSRISFLTLTLIPLLLVPPLLPPLLALPPPPLLLLPSIGT